MRTHFVVRAKVYKKKHGDRTNLENLYGDICRAYRSPSGHSAKYQMVKG